MFTYLVEVLSSELPPPEEISPAAECDATALAERAKNGDAEAFSEIVSCYERFVYNTACRVLTSAGQSVSDAEDIAQEAFIKAWRSLSSFRGDCSFSTWLFRVTVNTAKDVVRSHVRRPTLSLTKTDDNDTEPEIWDVPVTSGDEIPEEAVERRETVEAVRRAVECLPEEQRRAVVLRDIHDLPYNEIAAILDVEIGTVKSRINRGRANLKKILLNGNFLP